MADQAVNVKLLILSVCVSCVCGGVGGGRGVCVCVCVCGGGGSGHTKLDDKMPTSEILLQTASATSTPSSHPASEEGVWLSV